ncbi:hypothetical protein P3T36_006873 [Kitasatospora sp. MAP12-15]|uniref:hypothetical protein n=1 Tax=unclassified Kitasatospora TaxID=2633591 RepID=UPI002475B73F|nr:hypothetical protein [Kitasatospora sp. MAP12-44]MDH6111944.1 hypothetical protein [Kitasatospora sp. MAP12-44]
MSTLTTQELLAEVGRLGAELTAALGQVQTSARVAATAQQRNAALLGERRLVARTVEAYELILGIGGEGLVAWRAEVGVLPLGTYLARAEAQSHCVGHYRDMVGDEQLSWVEEEPDDAGTVHLHVALAADSGKYAESGYRVVPVPLLASYDSDGDS